ncbi:hypothetical protein FDECE_15560 [Fusarium decemcellulare]|nr:hypothetical protein FDECE_15560 [Fusarium decemcellulare]
MRPYIEVLSCLLAISTAVPFTNGSPVESRADKQVTIQTGLGKITGIVKGGVESFSAIPYAQAPTGKLRLKPPVRLDKSLGTFDATAPAGACPQMVSSTESTNFLLKTIGNIANLPFVQNATGQSEDCLTITVARPEGTKANARLPVLFWIFGGAFQLGWSSMYDGSSLVKYGVDTKEPFVFIAVNYRVNGFGFLPGKEVLKDGASNVGLLDQRMGLEWVADNIADFGGDPGKVTIWGESAGAISVADQMVLYNGDNKYKGKPLFRGAIMNSGNALPADPIDGPKGQAVYDQVVKTAGCADKTDSLNCLRELSYEDFLNAITSVPGLLSYNSIALNYLPRPDGKVLPKSPDVLIHEGKYAAVPMINGVQEDEGALFALFQSNLTSPEKLRDFMQDLPFQNAKTSTLDQLIATYGTGLTAITNGSPFRTGILNEIFPGFKRRAAVFGDVMFTLTRRAFLNAAKEAYPNVPSWSYLSSYNHGFPILGTFHGADLLQVFFGIKDNYAARSIRTYYINFVHTLNPNKGVEGKYPDWPRWDQTGKLANFGADNSKLIDDDFRGESYKIIAGATGEFNL